MTKTDCHKNIQIEQALKRMLKGSVPVISTDNLVESLSASSDWVVLDSREYPEFNVSHLPNAKWVGYADFAENSVTDIAKDTNIVVYCSIGVRSEKIAEKLQLLGFSKVWNLYGGIFNWANQGKALVDQNQQTTKVVHGYDKNWSKLVDSPFCDW